MDELRRAADSSDRVDPGYRRPVIEVLHREARNHNGGQVKFGPDGLLYLAPGDGGNAYDQPDRDARSLSSLLGKVLRIAPLAGGGYAAPADNPYFGAEAPGPQKRDEIWSYGLRNPFRFSFDRLTGDLFIGDVGQRKVEEVNHAPRTLGAGAGRGLNFGWDDCEGSFQAEPAPTGSAPCALVGDTPAVVEQIRPASGFCSITGGYVVRDPGSRNCTAATCTATSAIRLCAPSARRRPPATAPRPVSRWTGWCHWARTPAGGCTPSRSGARCRASRTPPRAAVTSATPAEVGRHPRR